MSRVAVVGGGISGLAAARLLADVAEVVVLEGSTRFGGKIGTTTLQELPVDSGAESMLARRPEAVALAEAVGLGPRLVYPSDAQPQVLIDDRAVRLPPSALGVPTDIEALNDLLTPAGLERARNEPTADAPSLDADLSIGDLVDQRFGPEVTDRLLEPLLGGVYAGHARRLSFAAVHPGLFERARQGGSLSRHAAGLQRPGSGPVFAGLDGGLGLLVECLVDDLRERGVELRTETVVRQLTSRGTGYTLLTGPAHRPEVLQADAVVLAAPATATGRLLAGLCPTGPALAAVPYASVAVVTLAVRGLEPVGSGLLVPPGTRPSLKAVTYSSTKWPWVAERAAAVWGPDACVVRLSIGRVGEESLLQLDDDALCRRSFAEATTLPGWNRARMVAGVVGRWGGGLPQYQVGHRDLVAGLRADLTARPGLAVCGAALDGVGIAACLGSAELAATKIIADLSGPPR